MKHAQTCDLIVSELTRPCTCGAWNKAAAKIDVPPRQTAGRMKHEVAVQIALICQQIEDAAQGVMDILNTDDGLKTTDRAWAATCANMAQVKTEAGHAKIIAEVYDESADDYKPNFARTGKKEW